MASAERRAQAWLYDSLNRSQLAMRLRAILDMTTLLRDWYLPWALLRQDNALIDVLTELVIVRIPRYAGARQTASRDRVRDHGGRAAGRAAAQAVTRRCGMRRLSPSPA